MSAVASALSNWQNCTYACKHTTNMTRTDARRRCVRPWFCNAEPLGERRYENWITQFLWFKYRTPWGWAHFGPLDLLLNKLGKRTPMQCYIPNFKHLNLAVLEKKIFKYILLPNPRPPAAGPFLTQGPSFEQLGKGQLANAVTYQSSSA